jgi:Domain of unknown function (DUF1707)
MVPVPGQAIGGETASPHLRTTDADRDNAIGILNESLPSGRLTADEHSIRVEAALRARTMGELSDLTEDLVPPRTGHERRAPWTTAIAAAIVALAALGLVFGLEGKSGPSHTNTPSAAKGTTLTTPQTNGSFVQPQPSLAGKFCQSLSTSQKSDHSTAGILGLGPNSNPWGNQPLGLSEDPSAAYLSDLKAVQSISNATLVVQMAWQKNGYQYAQLSTGCLAAYDSNFRWVPAGDVSNGPSAVSVTYSDRHSLIAARSDSGTCWYELNVMGPGDPVIAADDLQSYGVFYAKGGQSCAAGAAPSDADWERGGPLPPQLGS